jgi:uncharacterized protein
MRELSADECRLRLMKSSFVGRLAFVEGGEPIVLPVNYLADESTVTFCTSSGRMLSALQDGARVAFEIDDIRPMHHTGWSVLVSGTARQVSDPGELETLKRGPLKSWAAGPDAVWIRIAIESITGRELDQPEDDD